MTAFLNWHNAKGNVDAIIKAAVAHLWFVTIHPFEDGTVRIARAISEMSLARSVVHRSAFPACPLRYEERHAYYDVLKNTQKVTSILSLGCFGSWVAWIDQSQGLRVGKRRIKAS